MFVASCLPFQGTVMARIRLLEGVSNVRFGSARNRCAPANWLTHCPLTLPSGDRILTRELRMTIGSALKIGLGVVCFAIGAACLIGASCTLYFSV
jgi:hypothetical protein